MTTQTVITWDAASLRLLRHHYEQAVQEGLDTFTLQLEPGAKPIEFVTQYAKYLIRYLEPRLLPKRRNTDAV